MPLTVNEDDDSLPDERAAQQARDKGEPLQTLPTDDEPEVVAAPAAAAEAPAPAEAAAPAEATAPAPAPAEAPAPTEAPAPAEAATDSEGGTTDQAEAEPVQYATPEARDWAKEKAALRAEKTAADKQWSDGDLSDEDRAAKIGAIDDKLEELTREQTRIELLADINRQNAINATKAVLENIRTTSKAAGLIDYDAVDAQGNKTNGNAFDALFKGVANDPANAGLGFAQLAQKTHELLCFSRGLQPKAAAPAPAPAPAAAPAAPAAPAPRPAIPTSLQQMPTAAATPVANEAITAITGADPDEAEAMLERMNPAQKMALLHSTMPASLSRRH